MYALDPATVDCTGNDRPPHKLAGPDESVPLVVDLDGTLVRTDLLLESALIALRHSPRLALRLPLWLLRGPALLKRRLAERGPPDVQTLPYREDLLDYLRQARRSGRRIILATAADQKLAAAVAAELGLFDEVLASDGLRNCNARCKRELLIARFGVHGFDYVGNSWRDLPVWDAARHALLCGSHPHLALRIGRRTPVERGFSGGDGGWRDALRELRPHQWIKNLLVFLPLVASHQLVDGALLHGVLAFCAFTGCAAAVYILNDLFDLPADRRHQHKRFRPLASGRLGIGGAGALLVALLGAALLVSAFLPPYFLLVLGLYFITTLAYSLGLKDFAVLDVLILAGGYAARVGAGSVAAGVMPSPWLLAFCIFLFFSLALVKRYSELAAQRRLKGEKAHARGYLLDDLGVIAAQGIASGYVSVLVLALYTNSTMLQGPHGHYWLFWGNCLLLLYWISYLWLMADRGRIEDDPMVFALKDRLSLGLTLAMTAISLAAL